MSKYIIELDDRIKLVTSVGVTENGVVYTTSDYVHNLEELNSDYINEHYGELQDEAYQRGINDGSLDVKQRVEGAYQRGLEDGKWKAEDGCDGCKYYEDTSLTNPCSECTRAWKDHYTPAPHSDRIEVGDEVIAPCGKAVVTAVEDDLVHYFYSGGDNFGCVEPYRVTKTGKHYDIASILEAMRNDR